MECICQPNQPSHECPDTCLIAWSTLQTLQKEQANTAVDDLINGLLDDGAEY
jgi:hypothetical protein